MALQHRHIAGCDLYCGDALELLDQIAPSSVGALITDPPYSSGGAFRSDRMQSTRTKYLQTGSANAAALQDFAGDNRDQRGFSFWCALWMAAAYRAAVPGAPALLFTDWRQLPASTDYLQAGGWVWRGIVPWYKPGARPQMGRFTSACEYVVWGSAGAMPIERGVGVLPGFYEFGVPTARDHVTQKPLGLMESMLQIVPAPAVVLDPFMGSGSTGVAAVRMGRGFIGCEIDEAHFATACDRIQAAADQPRLFADQTAEQHALDLAADAGHEAPK